MLTVIHQFHDDMRECMRLDDGEFPDMFGVEDRVRGVCSRHCCSTFVFTAMLRVTENRFISDAIIVDNMALLQRKKEKMGK